MKSMEKGTSEEEEEGADSSADPYETILFWISPEFNNKSKGIEIKTNTKLIK